jgi:hypothetical protein
MYAGVATAFGSLAYWAEASAHAHPYVLGEEMFRFLLPSIVGRPGRDRIMLIGSSTAQEALLYQDFDSAFPGTDAYQVSYSMATLDDILVALDYVERVHGEAAMPGALIVGFETRSLANLPRNFGPKRGNLIDEGEWGFTGHFDETQGSFLFHAINRYSPHFSVRAGEWGSVLEPKETLEGWWAGLRFATRKQQPRYRSAVAALANLVLSGPGPNLDLVVGLPMMANVRNPFEPDSFGVFVRWIANDPSTALRAWIAAYVAPYVHHYHPKMGYHLPMGGEGGIGFWDPASDGEMVTRQLVRLRELAEDRDIRLFVVMVPEHPAARAQIAPERDVVMLALARRALGDTPFIDLRARFEADAFVDDGHIRPWAARLVTKEVIRAIEADGGLSR